MGNGQPFYDSVTGRKRNTLGTTYFVVSGTQCTFINLQYYSMKIENRYKIKHSILHISLTVYIVKTMSHTDIKIYKIVTVHYFKLKTNNLSLMIR